MPCRPCLRFFCSASFHNFMGRLVLACVCFSCSSLSWWPPSLFFLLKTQHNLKFVCVCDALVFVRIGPGRVRAIENAGVRRPRMQHSRRTRSGRQGCANLPAPVRSRRRRTSCCRRWSRTSTQDVISKEQVTRYNGWLHAVQTVVVAFGLSSERSETPDVLLN